MIKLDKKFYKYVNDVIIEPTVLLESAESIPRKVDIVERTFEL